MATPPKDIEPRPIPTERWPRPSFNARADQWVELLGLSLDATAPLTTQQLRQRYRPEDSQRVQFESGSGRLYYFTGSEQDLEQLKSLRAYTRANYHQFNIVNVKRLEPPSGAQTMQFEVEMDDRYMSWFTDAIQRNPIKELMEKHRNGEPILTLDKPTYDQALQTLDQVMGGTRQARLSGGLYTADFYYSYPTNEVAELQMDRVKRALARAGLNPNDVTLVQLPFTFSPTALEIRINRADFADVIKKMHDEIQHIPRRTSLPQEIKEASIHEPSTLPASLPRIVAENDSPTRTT